MIRAARRGRRVVRLKGGDPFVFGRGGEEALALRRGRRPLDVVPGVTSAIAAPALRRHSGHASRRSRRASSSSADTTSRRSRRPSGAIAPNGVTLVVLMGMARLAPLAGQLIDRGWAAGTPAAVVVGASTPAQQVWRGTLGDLAGGQVTLDSRERHRWHRS